MSDENHSTKKYLAKRIEEDEFLKNKKIKFQERRLYI